MFDVKHETYDVLKFDINQILDQQDFRLANVKMDSYTDHVIKGLVVKLTASILALPEDRIQVDEVVYDKWYYHLLDSSKILKKIFGEPPKRVIKIDQQIYSDIKTDVPIQEGQSYMTFEEMPKFECGKYK